MSRLHYPCCLICKNDIEPEIPSLHCQECSKWTHVSCEGDIHMNQAIAGKVIILGMPCMLSYVAYPISQIPFVFTMSDLELSNMFDSLDDSLDNPEDFQASEMVTSF